MKLSTLFMKNLMSLNMTGQRKRIINELQKNVNGMSVTIEFLKESFERQEQYSRSNCLLIHDLLEWRNNNTEELVLDVIKKMENKQKRMKGLKNNGKSRPIIMKFARYNTKCRIFKNKKTIEVQQKVWQNSIWKPWSKLKKNMVFGN